MSELILDETMFSEAFELSHRKSDCVYRVSWPCSGGNCNEKEFKEVSWLDVASFLFDQTITLCEVTLLVYFPSVARWVNIAVPLLRRLFREWLISREDDLSFGQSR
jgi:hypothetical protein